MIYTYLCLIGFVIVSVLFSMWSSNSEAKIKNIPRRDKGLEKALKAGYTISKRWDCNALTIFIDKKRKVLGFLTMAWRKDLVYYIPIDDIKEVEIQSVGIIKKSKIKNIITQVCLNIKTNQGDCILRTLIIKGIGLRKSSPHVILAQKYANEICESIESLKNKNK